MLETPESSWPILRRTARTVLVVDMVEFVRLMEADEEDTVRRVQRFVDEVANRLLPEYGGRLIKSTGDGMVVEFETVPPAIRCAHAMSQSLERLNAGRSAEAQMSLRMGAAIGDLYVDRFDIQGRAVNLAARLATIAAPGDIVVSAELRDRLAEGLDAEFEDLGDCWLKHFASPVRAYRATVPGERSRADTPTAAAELRPSLAVVPWLPRGDDARLQVIGEMVVDEIITALSRTPDLRVISRLSTSRLVDRADVLGDARRYLRADYVCTGTCSIHGETLRAHVELADTASGEVLLADTLNVSVAAVLGNDAELAGDLAVRLSVALLAYELSSARTKALPNLSAYTMLHGGVQLLHRFSPSDFERSRAVLEALTQRVPRHAVPMAWLARWHDLRVFQGWSPDADADAERAQDLSRRALDLDPNSSLALTTAGAIRMSALKDIDGSIELYRRAIAANPNEPLAWLLLGAAHSFRGEGPQAVAASEQALVLSPVDPMKFFFDALAASAALADERYERAIELALRSLKVNRTHLSTWRVLAIAQSLAGRGAEAQATVVELLQRDPGFTAAQFLARSPGGDFPIGKRFAHALIDAGLPRGG
jgi:adenylate cyclase